MQAHYGYDPVIIIAKNRFTRIVPSSKPVLIKVSFTFTATRYEIIFVYKKMVKR